MTTEDWTTDTITRGARPARLQEMTAGITFQIETFDRYYEDVAPLLRLHWREICQHPDTLSIDVDTELFRRAEAAGQLVVITGRVAGALVGYAVAIIHRHHHYRRTFVVEQDVSFLLPPYRRGSAGLRLLREMERAGIDRAIALGAERGHIMIAVRTKIAHNHAAIYRRRGYVDQDLLLTKVV